MYAVLRWVMDLFRGDDLPAVFGMTLSQAISIAVFFTAAAIYFFLSLRCSGKGKVE
jgi:hypothetical protein